MTTAHDFEAAHEPVEDPPSAAMRLAQVECEARLEAGQPMAAIDRYVDELPLDEQRRDAVRLHAWSYGSRVPPR